VNNDEYPTEKELEIVKEWDILKNGVGGLLEHIESIWWCPDWGFKLSGKRVFRLELHTGGWSGNEDIIEALKSNNLFWVMFNSFVLPLYMIHPHFLEV